MCLATKSDLNRTEKKKNSKPKEGGDKTENAMRIFLAMTS